MQKQIIFKIFTISVLFSISLFAGSLSSTEIVTMVAEIKKEREGISLLRLESTENPFIIHVPKKVESPEVEESLPVISTMEVVYTLKAILNKAAFIDNKWYKQGDSIGEYKVGFVSFSGVVLESENANKTLSLKKKNFIKSNRGYR